MKPKTPKTITDDQLTEIKEAFELFKSDNGKIDVTQIKYAYRALGIEPKEGSIDVNGKQKFITLNNFIEMASVLIPKRDTKSSLEHAFKLFDKDDSGKISFDDLKLVAINLGEKCTDSDLRQMIEYADADGDGEVSKFEFIQLISGKKIY
ncbi:centrin [Tieghemostelium lacteum]|uniref:Centrin n=1 Tax=Tieghemostelium lacteum TaxID=361077 RepID=A0A151Z634_TIELA|nr:centrin [Tieghemostelium lacteum]|eukprot:KYQ89416.1 centrin [Tieghemostelium lacteum]